MPYRPEEEFAQDSDDSNEVIREIFEFMQDLMAPSGLKKPPGQKTCEKDIALLSLEACSHL